MPRIDADRIAVAFDMQGCPNRCRHCWLGPASNRILSEADVRWGVSQFREYLSSASTPIRALTVATWFREPDYHDDYRDLYELEAQLGDGTPGRYELLSVWRLARDPGYAEWARSVGPDTCQISFFGLQETNDWFHRRNGAFADALTATERLLNAGMKPRWQLFLTTKLLPELDGLLALVDQYRLRERVHDLGGEFRVFMHPPGPDHSAREIETLRPTIEQVAGLPKALLAATREHFGRDVLWKTEATLYAEILRDEATRISAAILPGVLWFFVCSNWDVYSNIGTLEPWWRLGNLKQDSVESIIRTFEEDGVPGLRALFHESTASLAQQHGDPTGQRIYSTREDLVALYRAKRCETEWRGR